MDKKYYEYLKCVPGTNGNVNSCCAVVRNQVPFKNLGDAVKYAMSVYGDEYEPGSDVVTVNPQLCKQLSVVMYPEILRLVNDLEKRIRENDDLISQKAAERDSIQTNNILDQVHKELAQDRIHELIGFSSALHETWQALHSRQYELLDMIRYKG